MIFELLGAKKHLDKYNLVLKKNSIFECPSLKRLVLYHARKLEVDDDENLNLIDTMTLNGLRYDFFGNDFSSPDESISEKSFDIEVENGDRSYRIRGFIDKLFLYSKGSYALIRDFKSSKQVFKGKKVTDNLQDLMYSLAVSHLYPKYKNKQSEFLFLKFDLSKDMFGHSGSGVLKMEPLSDEELSGFEYELTEYQNQIDNFNENDATENFAGSKGYPSDGSFGGPLMCGKDGYKISRGSPVLDKSGEPIKAYICAFRKPFSYYALLDESGEVLRTCFTKDKEELIKVQKENQDIKLMEYSGCPYWTPSEHLDLFD